ncbi:DNA-directed DNA polymerase [Aeromonas phage vB_AspA_Tola]|nr:DNA-directed DNA polymerase [Aeromonas phage vB_AspA_Tola]
MNNWPFMHDKASEMRPSGKGRFLVGDIEAIGLTRAVKKPDDLHIITLEDYFSGEVFIFFDPEAKRQNPRKLEMEGEQDGYIADGIKMMQEAEALSFQNAVGFDAIVIEKVFKWFKFNWRESRANKQHADIFPFKLMDTMILSQLLYPDRPLDPRAFNLGMGATGPHSIAAHGIRMGRYKPDHEDWSTLTDDMIHRNTEDVAIGRDMLRWLMAGDWQEHLARGSNRLTGMGIADAYGMELQVAFMIARQEQRGFRLDMQRALADWNKIGHEMEATLKSVAPNIPPRLVTVPYKFAELKKRCDAAIKAGLPEDEIKAIFNFIHRRHGATDEPRMGDKATMWKLTTASGDYSKRLQGYFPEMRGNINDTGYKLVDGPFTPVAFEDIGLGNLDYIKERVLWPRGWRGVNFSDSEQEHIDETGETKHPWSGKIDEDSVKLWEERDPNLPAWAKQVVEYYVLRSRRSQILNPGDVDKFKTEGVWPKQINGRRECRGLMAVAYSKEYDMTAAEYFQKFREWPTNPDDEWRVPAAAFSLGTNTFRMRHRFVVNIPSRGLYPLRHLFIAGKGKKILGADGSGLELRMLAHFMADEVYTQIVLHGDIHSHNQEKANLPSRNTAKTFIYAFLYGSGMVGLASLANISVSKMERCIANFKAELPALSRLIDRCEEAGRKFGYFHAVDGRWGRIRKKSGKLLLHTALNVLLQMTGSLAMKYGECMAEDLMIAEGVALDSDGWPAFLANQHDEVQLEVDEDECNYTSYALNYSNEEGEDEKSAIKRVWGPEEKREHIDEDGRMWSAPKLESAADGVITVSRSYHRAGDILGYCFAKAGEHLKMRIPLAAEYKIGSSWADTH